MSHGKMNMDHQNNQSELLLAWKALSGSSPTDGWRSININTDTSCKIRAARYFPGNQEVLLLGFKDINKSNSKNFPNGKGFSLSYADLGSNSENMTWLALTRELLGSLDLFLSMAEDILNMLQKIKYFSDDKTFTSVLTRINAWQDFMKKNKEGILSQEEEIGLFGELIILEELTKHNISPNEAIDCWQGPLDKIQDFYLNNGGIEVKTTMSKKGFEVSISSLEQLDNTLIAPLFLIGVRLNLHESGSTLTNLIIKLKERWSPDLEALEKLNIKLLHAGFYEEFSKEYKRTFIKDEILTFNVDENFPKLIRRDLASQITKAKYTIDLDLISENRIDINSAITKLKEN